MQDGHGVTLVEVLIIVAVIAILAAIAIPNYNTAAIRARVAQTRAGMATLRGGLDAYRADQGTFPESDWAQDLDQRGAGLHRLTSPVAYVAAIPKSAFDEQNLGNAGDRHHAKAERTVLYLRATVSASRTASGESDANMNAVDDGYELDRMSYLYNVSTGPTPLSVLEPKDAPRPFRGGDLVQGHWMMKSVGPNNIDDRTSDAGTFSGHHARCYNPANGTLSHGDIVLFGDSLDGRDR